MCASMNKICQEMKMFWPIIKILIKVMSNVKVFVSQCHSISCHYKDVVPRNVAFKHEESL